MKRITLSLTTILLAALGGVLGGCADAPPQSDLATTTMRIGARDFTLEIADNDLARQRGLMLRDAMPADHGMIFVFDDERERSFWMKNTRIPLDIIYVSASERVVSIHSMRPYDHTPIPSGGGAQWAIELNQGAAAKAGVRVGDLLPIPPDARPKDR